MTDREVCSECGRPLPHEHADSPRERSVFSVQAPKGESAAQLVELLEQASARLERSGFVAPGERSWKFRNLHAILYAVATAREELLDELFPPDEGPLAVEG